MPDHANPLLAQDHERAQRRGDIYQVGREYRCTPSGKTLLRDGLLLYCPHCHLVIHSPGDPTP